MSTHLHTRSVLLPLLALACLAAAQDRDNDRNINIEDKDKVDTAAQLTYRSTVSEVRITFFATDENNRTLDTLTKSDFAVVDNECVIRNFRSFSHSDETSLDVVVLVDLSESVAPRLRGAISNVLQLVTREQSIPDDNISVVSFAGLGSAVLCSSSCRASDAASRLLAAKSGGA